MPMEVDEVDEVDECYRIQITGHRLPYSLQITEAVYQAV